MRCKSELKTILKTILGIIVLIHILPFICVSATLLFESSLVLQPYYLGLSLSGIVIGVYVMVGLAACLFNDENEENEEK